MSFDVIPTNDQTWLSCGGLHYADQQMFHEAMGDLIRLRGIPAKIVHGAACGADSMAIGWAIHYAITCIGMPADWKKHGRAAGPIRNQEMLDKHAPHMIIAFPGGRGTADMVSRARKAGIDLAEIKPTD